MASILLSSPTFAARIFLANLKFYLMGKSPLVRFKIVNGKKK